MVFDYSNKYIRAKNQNKKSFFQNLKELNSDTDLYEGGKKTENN